MKAIVFNEYGGPEVLHYSEVSDPSAGPGEIVVNVHAASINGADDKIRSGGGIYKALFPHKDVWAQRPDVRRDRAHLRRVLDLLEVRAVSPAKVQTFVLRDAAGAHRVAAMRHVMGKLVLTTSMEGEL